MPSSTDTGLMFKAIGLWILVMLPSLLAFITSDFTINIILITVVFPIMLSFLTNMNGSPFIVKTSTIGVASALAFFILYILSKIFPTIQNGLSLSNPGASKGTTIGIIVLIASVYGISMGVSGYFLPMLPMAEFMQQQPMNAY